MNDSERDYPEKNYEPIETASRDYDHLMYKPKKEVKLADIYPYDSSYPKSSKNFQETKKNDIYNYDIACKIN